MGSFVRISALIWADVLAGYALWVMVNYLTKVWKLNFIHAAAIVNFFTGAASIMPIGMAFLVHYFMSDFWMLLLSSLAFSIGMSFLAMSMPPVLSEAAGNCSAYKPDCIGNTQKVLFYTALALIAVGLAGHLTSLRSFLDSQTEEQAPSGEKQSEADCKGPLQIVGSLGVILFSIIGAIALPYVKPWSVRFGIPAICTVVATLLFLSGSCSYKRGKPDRGPLTPLVKIIIRIIPLWITFIMCGVVISIGNTYFLEQASNMNHKVGHLKVPLQIFLISHEIAKNIAKSLLGDEESKEQAPRVGSAEKKLVRQPSTIEIAGKKLAKQTSKVGYVGRKTGKKASTIGFAFAMISAVLCCITAARMETIRLGVIKRHGLIDKPDEKMPMSMFYLLPQFLLLGALGGFFEKSVDRFITDHVPRAQYIKKFSSGVTGAGVEAQYIKNFSSGVTGAGVMCSILTVYIAGKVSERGGKQSWFQDTLNKSRLDKYYWMLSVLTSVNLVLFILVAIWYPYQELKSADNDEAQGNEGTEAPGNEEIAGFSNDNAKFCCC